MKTMLMKSVVTSVAALVISTSASLAADVTMNVGFGAPESSLYGKFTASFAGLVEEYTGGTVEVKSRCCNQIGTEDDAIKALQLGTVDAFFVTANNVSPHWPLMDVTVLPYIFQNKEHLDKVLNGPIGHEMIDKLHKDTSVHLLAWGPVLYRDFHNSARPINSMADMAGLKIRVPKNEVMIATFEAFGANPMPLAWSEVATALQTGTVDGGDTGTTFIRTMKFNESQQHLAIMEHFVAFTPLFASDHFMKRLSDEQREQIRRAAVETNAKFSVEVAALSEEVRNWLTAEGGMTRTDPDRAEFIEAAKSVQQEFAAQYGQEFTDLVNQIQAAAN